MTSISSLPAVFLDRDGTLNVDTGYLYRIEDFVWIKGAREAIKNLNDTGYWVFVVTNQSGVARGMYGEDDVKKLHAWMQQDLASIGAHIDDFRYCPHLGDECKCRKPKPGMILDLCEHWPVDKSKSFLVGDTNRDVESANAAGITGYLYDPAVMSLDEFVFGKMQFI